MSDILPSLKYTRKLINEWNAALFFYYVLAMDLEKTVNKSKSNILFLGPVFSTEFPPGMYPFPRARQASRCVWVLTEVTSWLLHNYCHLFIQSYNLQDSTVEIEYENAILKKFSIVGLTGVTVVSKKEKMAIFKVLCLKNAKIFC